MSFYEPPGGRGQQLDRFVEFLESIGTSAYSSKKIGEAIGKKVSHHFDDMINMRWYSSDEEE